MSNYLTAYYEMAADRARIGESHCKEGEKVIQISSDGYCGEPCFTYHVSDDHHVHHVVDYLKHIPEKQRCGEPDQPAGHISLGEVIYKFVLPG